MEDSRAGGAPLPQADIPEEDTRILEEDVPAPEEDTLAPEEDTLAPEEDTLAPEEDTLAPEEDTLAPEEDTLAPEADAAAPEADAPSPAEERAPETEPEKPRKKRRRGETKRQGKRGRAHGKRGGRKRKNRHVRRIVGRALLFLFTVLIVVAGGLYAILGVVFNGPSQAMSDRVALTLMETSAAKYVPRLFFSAEEVEAIRERNKVVELEQATDTSLISVAAAGRAQSGEDVGPAGVLEDDPQDIIVDEIKGSTYHGWMMTVMDPSRVFVGVCADYFTEDKAGLRIADLAKKYDAVAAINGGAFSDHNGQGNGGMPSGVTITEGRMTNARGGGDSTTVGFDKNDVLIVGRMSRDEAEERGLRDAVSFGPALVINGEPAKMSGVSSGLNPRTAIGQRADGAVLMLVIDGRQVNSPGASMADLVEIMVRYGAVNACNLDGGSSSNIYYNGEILNDGVAITGSRRIPTAFVVR